MFKSRVVSTWPLNTPSRNGFLPIPGRWFLSLYFQASLYSRCCSHIRICMVCIWWPWNYLCSLYQRWEYMGQTCSNFFCYERNLILPFSWANLCYLMLWIPWIIQAWFSVLGNEVLCSLLKCPFVLWSIFVPEEENKWNSNQIHFPSAP